MLSSEDSVFIVEIRDWTPRASRRVAGVFDTQEKANDFVNSWIESKKIHHPIQFNGNEYGWINSHLAVYGDSQLEIHTTALNPTWEV